MLVLHLIWRVACSCPGGDGPTPNDAMGLTCYCENYCPEQDRVKGTCIGDDRSYCFSAIQLVYVPELQADKEHRTFGCLSSDETGLMQCRSDVTAHARPKNITCCREYDLCNQHLFPQLSYQEDDPPSREDPLRVEHQLLLAAIVVMAFLALSTLILWYLCRQRIKRQLQLYKRASSMGTCGDVIFPEHKGGASDTFDASSGSGSGLSRLVQLTIGKQIEQICIIGKGRYGEVLLGKWRGESVAVKVFSTTDEASWLREKEIYQTVLLRHENILGFIAADIRGTASHTQMLLITEYHDLGSLYDYLKIYTLEYSSLFRMTHSIIAGLSHLHTEIFGTTGKPAIAHRDIKSKNILVKKRSGECCIADFGLAVKFSSQYGLDVGSNPKVGTRRYMAPEVLNDSLNISGFESLKCADVYSVSLVLWEVCRRCSIRSGENHLEANDYQLPYFDCVSADPSFEDMLQVVCIKGFRPQIPNPWFSDPVLRDMSKILQECWDPNPRVRWTALKIKKRISELRKALTCSKQNFV